MLANKIECSLEGIVAIESLKIWETLVLKWVNDTANDIFVHVREPRGARISVNCASVQSAWDHSNWWTFIKTKSINILLISILARNFTKLDWFSGVRFLLDRFVSRFTIFKAQNSTIFVFVTLRTVLVALTSDQSVICLALFVAIRSLPFVTLWTLRNYSKIIGLPHTNVIWKTFQQRIGTNKTHVSFLSWSGWIHDCDINWAWCVRFNSQKVV